MSAAEVGDVRREPDPISRADYQGHEVRIIKLEEFRNHVATREWVYKSAFIAIGIVSTVGATVGSALVRALWGA